MQNKKRILAVAIITGFLAAVIGLSSSRNTAQAQDKPEKRYKNLKILPKDIGKKELKKLMKAQAKAVGRKCSGATTLTTFHRTRTSTSRSPAT